MDGWMRRYEEGGVLVDMNSLFFFNHSRGS